MNRLEYIDNQIGETRNDKQLPIFFRAKIKTGFVICTQNHPACMACTADAGRKSSGKVADEK
jgi:hypothetical protein